MMKLREIHARIAMLVIAVVAVIVGYHQLFFKHVPTTFNDPLEDMSFAWYVPLFSLYVIWTERKQLRDSIGSPSVIGLLLMVPLLFMGFLGIRGIQVRFEMLAIIGLVIVLPWTFFGWKTAKQLLFPAAFLLFCIPLATFLDIITVHLRLISTSLAYGVLKGIGAEVVRTGTMLTSVNGTFAIDIAEPCSGLRSIFALLALTAGYAYFNQPTWLRRLALFAFAVPLAVFGNMMRIFTICLVGTYASPKIATGFYHDYSGYITFLAAIALMVAIGEGITKISEAIERRDR